MKCRYVMAMIGVALFSTIGCGASDDVPVAEVTGKVTYQGKPIVGGGSITFVPDGKGQKAAGGTINDDGTFVLSTYGDGDGAIPGKHRVEVRQNLVLQEAKWPESTGDAEPPKDQKPISPEVRVSEADQIPEFYSGAKSPLIQTVEADGGEYTFDLKPQ